MNNTLIQATIEHPVINTAYIASFIFGILGTPWYTVAILVGFMCLDFITAITRDRILFGKGSFSSTTFNNGVLRKVVLLTVPCILALTGVAIHIDLSVIVFGAFCAFAVGEAYSNYENLVAIYEREKHPKKDFHGKTLGALGRLLARLFDKTK